MKNRNPATQATWMYFLMAFGFSWLFWIPAIFIQGNVLESPGAILLGLGGIGPAVSGIFFTYLNKDKESRKEYWQRVFDLKRIGAPWYLVILLAYPLVTVLLAWVENGQVQITQAFQEVLMQPVRILPFTLFIFIFGPLPEELGWRGFALDGLQRRMNALKASVLLGTCWALWHLPLFFMEGSYQNELGFGSAACWRFMLFAVVGSIFFTWIFNNTQRSTLSAMLFHFSTNYTGNIFEVTAEVDLHRLILIFGMAVVVIFLYGAKDLVRKPIQTKAA